MGPYNSYTMTLLDNVTHKQGQQFHLLSLWGLQQLSSSSGICRPHSQTRNLEVLNLLSKFVTTLRAMQINREPCSSVEPYIQMLAAVEPCWSVEPYIQMQRNFACKCNGLCMQMQRNFACKFNGTLHANATEPCMQMQRNLACKCNGTLHANATGPCMQMQRNFACKCKN